MRRLFGTRGAVLTALLVGTVVGGCTPLELSSLPPLQIGPDNPQAHESIQGGTVGRLALDYTLTNRGNSIAHFSLEVQGSTSGNPDANACGELAGGHITNLRAVALGDDEAATPGTLRTLDRLHRLQLPDDDTLAYLNLRIRQAGQYRIFSSSADSHLEILDTDFASPRATPRIETSQCEGLPRLQVLELDEGLYRLLADEDGELVLVELACESQRAVPATCPGAHQEPVLPSLPGLDPGASHAGRIPGNELGIGDTIRLALSCGEGSEGCEGQLETVLVEEALACRRSTECSGGERCSEEGYCVAIPNAGCSTVPMGRASSPSSGEGSGATARGSRILWLGLVLLALALPQRRHS